MAHKKYEDKMDEEVNEKTSDAKRNLRIDELKKKGYSERDAVIKGMASMKKAHKDSEGMGASVAPASPDEEYPYGLRLRLENEELEKLGLSELPEVGKRCKIMAEGVVESVSSNESKGSDGNRKSVEIQVTGMKIDKADSAEGTEVAENSEDSDNPGNDEEEVEY